MIVTTTGDYDMKNCLVVDDSSVIRKVARRILEDLSFEITEAEVRERTRGTFLDDARVVRVSATTSEGLDSLLDALEVLVANTGDSDDLGRARLFVDRVFSAKGSGTVVTGTLTHGSLAVGQSLDVVPNGVTCRIRALQVHGRPVDRVGPGFRVAVNLSGVDVESLRRGCAVVVPERWHTTVVADASFTALPSLDHEVSRRGAHSIHIGSDESAVRVRILGDDAIRPGGTGFVRLHLAHRLPLVIGDRFVLRESGRDETVGGGVILDVDPVEPAARARPVVEPESNRSRIVRERAWLSTRDFERLTGARRKPDVGDWIVDPEVLARTRRSLTIRIAEAGAIGLETSSLDDRERAVLDSLDEFVVDSGRARPRDTVDPLMSHPVIDRLHRGGCAPPSPDGITTGELRRLQKAGLLFERDGEWFHTAALAIAADAARRLLAASPEGFTMSQFRETLGITRKHAVPLATELDQRGITRRRDDVRIAGPRLDAR